MNDICDHLQHYANTSAGPKGKVLLKEAGDEILSLRRQLASCKRMADDFAKFIAEMQIRQQELGPEFQAVLNANRESLYES